MSEAGRERKKWGFKREVRRRYGKGWEKRRERGRKSETWPRVCLTVTLSKARGAEQPNYDLRPLP